jgi:CBS domain containing-hemolysin-like protein
VTPSLGLALVALLIAANAFFVAAEFGLVAARRATIEELADGGSRRARLALREMRDISFMLTGAQFGITISSLLLGYIAESAFAQVLAPVIDLFGLPAGTSLAVSLGAALGISTVVQMVVGELAPKNIAIARPEGTALALAPIVRGYAVLFGWIIRFFDGAANAVTRWLGSEPREELLAGYSSEELARIINASRDEGSLPDETSELMLRAVELGERRISEIMVPRPDVTWLEAGAPASAIRDAARRTGHSRFPVHGGKEDDVVGTVHIKDLLHLGPDDADTTTIAEIADEAVVVPESHTWRRLLADLRRSRRTFAVVVDEYGGVAGIATIEDVLEELVGEIEDEFDREVPALRRLGAGRVVIPGRLRVARLEELLEMRAPEGDFETVAGLVIDLLGHIPSPGEQVELGSWRFIVMSVEGNRIVEVLLERVAEAEDRLVGDAPADEELEP